MSFNRFINRSPQQLHPRDRMQIAEAKGRPLRVVAGSWISDLVTLGKTILLCDKCAHKFNYQQAGYQVMRPVIPGHNYVISKCDGCKRNPVQCSLHQKRG